MVNLGAAGDYGPHFVLYPLWKENINVSLDMVFAAIDSCYVQPAVKAQSSHTRAMLLVALLYSALYVNDNSKIEEILGTNEKERMVWNMPNFNLWYGPFDAWMNHLNTIIKERDEFIKRINRNKTEKK